MDFQGIQDQRRPAPFRLLAVGLLALFLPLSAQAGPICASPDEEALLAKGFIFFPARVICPPEPVSQVTKVAPPTNEPVATPPKATQTTAAPRPDPQPAKPEPIKSFERHTSTKSTAKSITKEQAQAILIDSLPEIRLPDGTKVRASSQGFKAVAPSNLDGLLSLGLKQAQRAGQRKWLWTLRWAKYLTGTYAVGMQTEAGSNYFDFTANSWLTNPSGSLSLFSSLGYTRGVQDFNFFSGPASTALVQTSGLLDLHHTPEWSGGFSTNVLGWHSYTSQPEPLPPITYIKGEAPNTIAYRDRRALALGGTEGVALGFKLPLGDHLSVQHQRGQQNEWMRYRNGARSAHQSRYALTSAEYFVGRNWGEISLHSGAAGKTARLTHQVGNLRLTYQRVSPMGGGRLYQSVGVGYHINLYDISKRATSAPNDINTEQSETLERRSILERVASRPTQFPQHFSAEVDKDNVSLVSTPTANAGPDQAVASGATVTLTGLGSTDPDNDTLTYVWTQTSGTAVTLSDATAAQPTFTAPTLNVGDPATTLTFSLTVADGTFTSAADSVTVTVGSPADTVTWISSGQVGELFDYGSPSRQSVSIQLAAMSNGGAAITYDSTLVSGSLPPGLTINAAGVITGNTPAVTTSTDYTFVVTAKSATGSSSVSGPLSIRIQPPILLEWTTAGARVISGGVAAARYITSTTFIKPAGLQTIELLAVGGGGGGGYMHGGGGGGGTVAYSASYDVAGAGASISVSIGIGGAGGFQGSGCNGASGGATMFHTINAYGGGGGGNEGCVGVSGGSAGGTNPGSRISIAGGAECGTTVSGVSYYCSAGGGTTNSTGYFAGGGGGASGAGTTSVGSFTVGQEIAGDGGPGYVSNARLGSITVGAGGGGGYSVCTMGADAYAGYSAGAGGPDAYSAGEGGSGVGGSGGKTTVGADALANTGSGGGGGGESFVDGCQTQTTTHSPDRNGGAGSGGIVRVAF